MVKTKTFVIHEDPDPDDLENWESEKEYKKGDQVNFEDSSMECRTPNKDKTFDQKKWGLANNDYECTIRKPGFKEINAALSSMANMAGELNFGSGGKIIFELCKIKADPMFREENGTLLFSLCIMLGNFYLRTYAGEIKKN